MLDLLPQHYLFVRNINEQQGALTKLNEQGTEKVSPLKRQFHTLPRSACLKHIFQKNVFKDV